MQALALVTYPPPSDAKLRDAQRKPFRSILVALEATNFDSPAIHKKMPSLIVQMTSICSTEADQLRMIEQLDDWVRWHRLGGYYLSYIFQKSMQDLGVVSFIPACVLFADAQNQFADDLSLISLENAYTSWKSWGADRIPTAARRALLAADAELRSRLRMTYAYYRRLYSSESYTNINQLAEGLYFERAWIDLRRAFPELPGSVQYLESAACHSVIDRCVRPEDAYCRVVARRMLGLVHSGRGDLAAAKDAYSRALIDAQTLKLNSEIGHLHRLLGWSLMRLGFLDEAEQEQIKALAYENHPKFAYWQALTLGELGDVRMRRLGSTNPPQGLAAVAEAYAGCLYTFERSVAGSVLPVARAVKQQLMRSYVDNAVQIAEVRGRPGDLVAAIEAFGPRYANDLVAEGRVAATLDAPSYERFRKARAIVHGDLGALSMSADLNMALEKYLTDVITHREERQYYLTFRNEHVLQIAEPQFVQMVVKRMLALRIPNTVLMLVNVERVKMHVVVVDASIGQPLVSGSVPLDASEWRQAHGAYDAAVQAARRASQNQDDPAPLMRPALDALIEFYERGLGGVLEEQAQVLEGRHLKIFPRFRMNQAPLHAARVGSKRLIDLCEVSYAPSLSLFLQVHEENVVGAHGALTILHDAARTHFYSGTVGALTAQAANAIVTVPGPSWQNFRASLGQRATSDVFFACHGQFNDDDPKDSRLEVTRREPVKFEQIYADLDLRGYRSVLMGACESGLGRTLVSAEYIGLPIAFLAAGVRYVIGALWEVAQLPAAILVAHHYSLLLSETRSVVNCLNEAARRLKAMSRDDVMTWVQKFVPEKTPEVEAYLQKLHDPPFAHPYYWAGFYVSGDT